MTPADFRAIRVSLRLTQAAWGGWLGVTPQHVAKLERGAATITPTLALLVAAYRDGWRRGPNLDTVTQLPKHNTGDET